jgi:hypothetical protein
LIHSRVSFTLWVHIYVAACQSASFSLAVMKHSGALLVGSHGSSARLFSSSHLSLTQCASSGSSDRQAVRSPYNGYRTVKRVKLPLHSFPGPCSSARWRWRSFQFAFIRVFRGRIERRELSRELFSNSGNGGTCGSLFKSSHFAQSRGSKRVDLSLEI